MAKMDTNDVVGKIQKSNSWGEFNVLRYVGKNAKKKHEYEIQFIDTNNKCFVNRDSIKRGSCVDEVKKRLVKLEKQKKEQEEMKRMNAMKGKEYIEWDKKHCRILALDQALNVTGLSYYIDNVLMNYGTIETNTKLSYIEKTIKVRDDISKMIDKYEIDVLALEDTYVYKNVQVYKKLSLLLGVLQIMAIEKGIRVVIVTAPEWKGGVGILKHKGREAQKTAGLIKIREKYDIHGVPDDISDSILIGSYVANNCIRYTNSTPTWD